MRLLKALVAVIWVCYSFCLNSFGQKVEIIKNEIYANGNFYGIIERIPHPDLETNNSATEEKVRRKLDRIPSYALYSPNKNLIAYIYPDPDQIRPSNKTLLFYTVLFGPGNSRKFLKYAPIDSIKPIILDIVNFELINNNTLDRSSLRRLFEKYGKDVKYASLPRKRIYNDPGRGTAHQYYMGSSFIESFVNTPIWQINNIEKEIRMDNRIIAKFDNLSISKDSLIKKVNLFDKFNTFKASITLLGTVEEVNNYFLLNYNLVTDKGEKKTFIIQISSIIQNSLTQPENIPLHPKIRWQLIEIGKYLQENYFL